ATGYWDHFGRDGGAATIRERAARSSKRSFATCRTRSVINAAADVLRRTTVISESQTKPAPLPGRREMLAHRRNIGKTMRRGRGRPRATDVKPRPRWRRALWNGINAARKI